jgi:ubiquinone/menaquinone biosynthesis C-methylase UbiE
VWNVTESDNEKIKSWGLNSDPFAAVKDFSWVKAEQRWLNPEQLVAIEKYIAARNDYIQSDDFDTYYQNAEKPIDKDRWTYLKNRKAWYIIPLNWQKIAEHGGKVIDLGCGDGDSVQRLVDFVIQYWTVNSIKDKTLEIVGVDLNTSRVENAKSYVTSSHPSISCNFYQWDIIRKPLEVPDDHYDFSLCCGVLEILDDNQFEKFLKEMCRVTSSSIFIEDLYERFPGGYPRDDLGKHLARNGFFVTEKKVVMSEPFSKEELQDPKKIWPNFLDQIIWADAICPEISK